jgi:dipeptidyl-peptidase-4
MTGVLREDVVMTDSYPRQRARTRAFRLGAPRAFTPSDERVVFLRSKAGSDPLTCLWSWDLESRTERLIVDPADILADDEELPAAERARRERMREVSGGVTAYSVDAQGLVAAFALSGTPYAVRLDGLNPEVIEVAAPGPVIDPRIDPTGTRVAYVSDRAVWVADISGEDAERLTHPDSNTVTWGLADFAAAEELDRMRGFWWLADASGLLVERFDDAPVQTWWIADPSDPAAAPTEHRYPQAGTANADVSLWLVLLDGTHTEVTWDHDALPYLQSVHVSKHGDPLVTLLSRDQRRQVILAIDPHTAGTRQLRERTDAEWVDVVGGVPCWDEAGRLLEVVADRKTDTYRLVRDDVAVTPEGFQVHGVLDLGADWVIVHGGDNPFYDQATLVTDAGLRSLPTPVGMSSAIRGGRTLVTTSTTIDSTATCVQIWCAGIGTDELLGEIASRAEVPLVQPKVFSVGDSQTVVVFPTGYQPGSRALPVIMSPYGGPHARMVVASGLAFGSTQWLADQGFAIVVADGRGTPGRGPAWDRTVKGDLASVILEDQVSALVAAAAAYPGSLDTTRVGIRGWSFGGYLAALAVLRRPDVFHAAVAGAPVTEWRLYDTAYTERYLGHPDEDPAAYERSSLLPLAGNLERPLLLVHGLADDNVVMAHTLQLSGALLAAGKSHSVLPLSGVTHMTPQEIIAENLLLAELDFFRRNL